MSLQRPAILIHIARFTCKNFKTLVNFSNTTSSFKDTIENYALADENFTRHIHPQTQPTEMILKFLFLAGDGEIMKPFLKNLGIKFFNSAFCDDIYKIDFILFHNFSSLRNNFYLRESNIDKTYIAAMESCLSNFVNLTGMSEEIFHMIRKYRKTISSVQVSNNEELEMALKYYPEIKTINTKNFNCSLQNLENLRTLHIKSDNVVLHNLPKLEDLYLTNVSRIEAINAPSLIYLSILEMPFKYNLNGFENLKILEIKKVDRLNCHLFRDLNLESLTLRNIESILNFRSINFSALQTITIDNISIDDNDMKKFKETSELKNVNIQNCKEITTPSLLFIDGSKLKRAVIRDCKNIHDIIFIHEFIKTTSINASFDFGDMKINKIYLNFIRTKRSGKRIPDFYRDVLDDNTLSLLLDFEIKIDHRLCFCNKSITTIKPLFAFQNISELVFLGCPITDGNEFLQMKNLSHLTISGCNSIKNFDFVHQMNLMLLDVSYTSFGIDDLEKTKIKKLAIQGCPCLDNRKRLNKYLVANQKSSIALSYPYSPKYFDIVENILRKKKCPPISIDSDFEYYLEFGCDFEEVTIDDASKFIQLQKIPNLKNLKLKCKFNENDFSYVYGLKNLETLVFWPRIIDY